MTEMDEPLLKEMSEDSLMAGDMEIRATTGGVAMRRESSSTAKDRILWCFPKPAQPKHGGPLGKSTKLDSFDFDHFESYVHQVSLRNMKQTDSNRVARYRWGFIIGIAVIVALIAVFITYCTRKLSAVKFNAMSSYLQHGTDNTSNRIKAYFSLLGYSVLYAMLASFAIAVMCPAAGGSGIPALKCILNGVKIPKVVRFKTLVYKVISVIFAVASGLPLGKEGPMIHNGAIVGSGIAQGKSITLGIDTQYLRFHEFRNDREKRDFIVCGAAAGVAAAFGAPVGGLLFVLEEAASFWFQSLTWRTFFCAMVTTYVLDLMMSGVNEGSGWGELSTNGMFTFGDFSVTGQNNKAWKVTEIPFFLILGAFGGLFGALFNWGHKRLSIMRARWKLNAWQKMTEVLLIMVFVTTVSFLIPICLARCRPMPTAAEDPKGEIIPNLVQFYCEDGSYSLLASLFLQPAENVIKMLFHFTKVQFELAELLLYFVFYLVMTCVTLGTAVASGLFYPSMVAGAAFGRMFGQVLQTWTHSYVVDSGTYAFIGCAGMLGGFSRMTVSLAVMLLESTGDYQFGLPLMAALMAARWTGNLFNHGVYDVTIELQHWPHLEDHAKKAMSSVLVVSDIMTQNPIVFREVERVGVLIDILRGTDHNGYPVLHCSETLRKHPRLGTLAGIVNRRHLCVLLQKRVFTKDLPEDHVRGEYDKWLPSKDRSKLSNPSQNLVSWEELEETYPRYPLPEKIVIHDSDRDCWLDLRPYMNRTVYTVNDTAPVVRAFRLFRTLGLRVLVVVNDYGDAVGLLTRAELTHHNLQAVRDRLEGPRKPRFRDRFRQRHNSITSQQTAASAYGTEAAVELFASNRAFTAVEVPHRASFDGLGVDRSLSRNGMMQSLSVEESEAVLRLPRDRSK